MIEGVDSCVHGVLHPPAAGEHLPLRHNQVDQAYQFFIIYTFFHFFFIQYKNGDGGGGG